MIVLLSDLLGRASDDIELTPSPETEENDSKGVEHDQTALSMAEIASCSYEARYSKTFICVSPSSISNGIRNMSINACVCVFIGRLV